MTSPNDPLTVDRTHGGVDHEDFLDFSTSINPLGPPPQAIEAYKNAAASIALYPPPYPRGLESRVADWLGIDSEWVIGANGSTQLIYLVARVLKLRSPWVVTPTFSEIANALIAAGSTARSLQAVIENDFRLDLYAVRVALRSGADAIFVGRPNSPTGNLVSLQEAAEIAAECRRHNAWCIFDEAFIEFAEDPRSVVELVSSFPKLLVLRSLTKIFAIPGLRLGYLVGQPEYVTLLRDCIEPWSVNVAAEAVARACLTVAPGFIEKTRDFIASERRKIEAGLSRLPKLRAFPSSANFIMVEAVNERGAGDFARHLLGSGIVPRDLSALPGCGPGLYRLGIRSPQDNARFLTAAVSY